MNGEMNPRRAAISTSNSTPSRSIRITEHKALAIGRQGWIDCAFFCLADLLMADDSMKPLIELIGVLTESMQNLARPFAPCQRGKPHEELQCRPN